MSNPLPGRLTGYIVGATGVAVLMFFPMRWLPGDIGLDSEFTRAAFTMIALGVSLTAIITGLSAPGGRIRPGTRALVNAFGGIGVLGATCLVLAHLPPAASDLAIMPANVLESGMELVIATGVLAVSWLVRTPEHHASRPRPIDFAPAGVALGLMAFAVVAAASGAQEWLRVGPLAWAPVVLLLYVVAGARLYAAARKGTTMDAYCLLAAVVTGILAELLAALPNADAAPRLVVADLYRITSLVFVYTALFHRVARGPLIELRRAEADLRVEQSHLARTRRMAKLGSWEWQIDSDAVWTSQEVRQLFNIPSDKAGMTRSEFEALLYREDVARLRAATQAALETNAPYSIDYRILGADGSPRTMHSEAQVERDASGKPVRMSGVVQDITERVAVEHALRESDAQIRRMNAELEQRVEQRTRQLAAANKELEAFSYSVTHDLQAPLRRIERYAELLGSSNAARLDDSGRDMLRRIGEATSQTKRLIGDILKLSQVTRAEIRRVAVDLSALARRVIDQIERSATPARKVDVTVDPGMVIEADADMLQILLDNLLGNAWKFTSRTEKPQIHVGALPGPEGTGFYVSDNGAGFDMRYESKLFGAFQRLHSQDEFKGTGIGLAIVQRIVNVHGWQIQASGETGRGATFTIKAH